MILDLESNESRAVVSDESLATWTWPIQWLPDGSGILVAHSGRSIGASSVPVTTSDLSVIDPTRPGELIDLLSSPYSETDGQVSPDGRWLAYASDVSGRKEIYVRPFRSSGADWQVSTDGGSRPRWARDGSELYFLGADGWLRAASERGPRASGRAAPRARATRSSWRRSRRRSPRPTAPSW